MPVGVLVDIRNCIGCRACQVACKRWHVLPAEATKLSPTWTNPTNVSALTWTFVKFFELGKADKLKWRFVKWQCMHCVDAPCVRVCPTKALYKTKEGFVLYNEGLCVGCRYCVQACPFNIPVFDWGKMRVVQKCTLCVERIIEMGLAPACVGSCPPRALQFTLNRDEAVARAEKARAAGAYVYGINEVGGLTWIYISDFPFSQLGFPTYGTSPPLTLMRDLVGGFVVVGIAGGLVLYGLEKYTERRAMVKKGEGK